MCPPVGTSTNLNYDLVNAEKVDLDDEVRDDLVDLASEWVEEAAFADVLEEIKSLEETNQWVNWYNGYTEANLPYTLDELRQYWIKTTATQGAASSPWFGHDCTKKNSCRNNEINFCMKKRIDLYWFSV